MRPGGVSLARRRGPAEAPLDRRPALEGLHGAALLLHCCCAAHVAALAVVAWDRLGRLHSQQHKAPPLPLRRALVGSAWLRFVDRAPSLGIGPSRERRKPRRKRASVIRPTLFLPAAAQVKVDDGGQTRVPARVFVRLGLCRAGRGAAAQRGRIVRGPGPRWAPAGPSGGTGLIVALLRG